MPSYEELVLANDAIWSLLSAGAGARLAALPGVVQVSVGAKERAGRATRELCIRVYVKAKRALNDLTDYERIPPEIDGVPTDVIVDEPAHRLDEDTTEHRPLKGGICISNNIIASKVTMQGKEAVIAFGTFGCVATRTSNRKAVLLTNWHVAMAHEGSIGAPIFQPGLASTEGVQPPDTPLRPTTKDGMIATIVDAIHTDRVDAAIAELDVSSCCRCCGLDFRNEINGLSENGRPPSSRMVGMRVAVPTKAVFKVGITTGRKEGIVVDMHKSLPQFDLGNGVKNDFVEQMVIAAVQEEEFSLPGDSGSVIVDEDGYIVGLLFGGNSLPAGSNRGYANRITDVCAALHITINLDHTTHTAGARVAVPADGLASPADVRGAELYAAARARLLASPAGAWLLALAEEHRAEIVTLVTTHRPVTVAWHRAGGPAVFASAVEAVRAGNESLPLPPNGLSLERALSRVGDALAAHGTPALRAAIAQHRTHLLAAVRDSRTFGDVLETLSMLRADRADTDARQVLTAPMAS